MPGPRLLAIAGASFFVVLGASALGPRLARRLGAGASAADRADAGTPSLFHAEPLVGGPPQEGIATTPLPAVATPVPSALAGLSLARIASDTAGLYAPTTAGNARLTLDPELQRTALGLMTAHHLPEAAVVLMDVATGRLLVYASHVDKGAPRDLCAEAKAPSASVFKIVTAAALVEDAHLGPDTKQCYSGGESRITSTDLVDNPQRDRQCSTLAGAMGRSINTVFARLASGHLSPPQLDAMARRFGYGQGVPFDVPVEPSALHVPADELEFARTAAGFWNTTMSPLQAIEISAIVARGGEAVRPSVVDKVMSSSGAVLWSAPASDAQPPRRVVARDTADQLQTMMDQTVSEGTSWHAFHDAHGLAFLPGIEVAGKTGTLTDADVQRYYTWFTGFAPARPLPNVRQVAIAVLVVNGPSWEVKANVIARDVLRAYFAAQEAKGVTAPSVAAIVKFRARRAGRHAS